MGDKETQLVSTQLVSVENKAGRIHTVAYLPMQVGTRTAKRKVTSGQIYTVIQLACVQICRNAELPLELGH